MKNSLKALLGAALVSCVMIGCESTQSRDCDTKACDTAKCDESKCGEGGKCCGTCGGEAKTECCGTCGGDKAHSHGAEGHTHADKKACGENCAKACCA